MKKSMTRETALKMTPGLLMVAVAGGHMSVDAAKTVLMNSVNR
jgi:hypothetical protein